MGFFGDFAQGFAGNGGSSAGGRTGTAYGNLTPWGWGARALGGHQMFQDAGGPTGFEVGKSTATGPLGQEAGLAPDSGGSGPFGFNQYAGPQGAAGQVHQAQGYDPSTQPEFRAAQVGLLHDVGQQAQGLGPSLAQMQLRDATNRNVQQATGLIAGQRGINPGLATYMAGNQLAAINQQAAGQSAEDRLQEQMQARGLLGNLTNEGRSADLGVGQLGQQNAQWNAGAFNTQLGSDTNNTAAFGLAHAQQIAEMERQRRQMNLQARNKFLEQGTDAFFKTVGGGMNGGGAGMQAGAGGIPPVV